MTDEQKDCKKCECCKLVCKFFFLSGAVFLGTLMAILFAHALLKPKFPACPFKTMRPGIERQMPPRMHHIPGQRPDYKAPMPARFRHHQRPDFNGRVPQPEGKVIKLGVEQNR